ncbi:MAG: hypothetical protein ABII19_02745 [Patescibacteria group bacterium]
MNKKVLVPVVVVLAVAVLAGGYWAWQRYEEQRAARQFLSGLAALGGANADDLQKLAESANKLAEANEESEAARTPEEKYNATEEIQVDIPFVKKANDDIGSILSEVFGDIKLSSYLNNYLGMGENSGMVQFMTKREATSGDLNKLTSVFANRGFTIITSGVNEGNASLMATKDNAQYTLTYESGGQEVAVIIFSTEITE